MTHPMQGYITSGRSSFWLVPHITGRFFERRWEFSPWCGKYHLRRLRYIDNRDSYFDLQQHSQAKSLKEISRRPENRAMKSFIQSAASLLEQGIEACHLSPDNNLHDAIVPGYSYPLTEDGPTPLQATYERGLVGVLYADIVDYSRLSEEDEEGIQQRLAGSMEIMQAQINANNGRVVHLADDAVLAEFKDADSALHCAINVQLSARQGNANFHANQQVLFRIGVSFGDVITDQDDVFSNAVNLASRLEKLAHTGGICVAESIRHRLKDHPSFKFVATGKQYMKNISEPVQAFWIEFDAEQVENSDHTSAVKVSAVAS